MGSNTKKIFKKLYHVNCNEFTSSYYYKEVYPNLFKIYDEQYNDIKFADLMLNYNVSVPINWHCDKCDNNFILSIERLLKKIKRDRSYCEKCKATFSDVVNNPNKEAPLSFLTPELLSEWSDVNKITNHQADQLSDIDIKWSCSKCMGTYICKVYERDKRSCPYCNGYKKLKDYNTLNITHTYLKRFWNSSNSHELSDYWYRDNEPIMWKCPCCNIDFQCSPSEIISRTIIENQNFQTCPNHCDWLKDVLKNDFLAEYPLLLKEWSKRNKIPIHLAATHIETQKYWWTCSNCHEDYQCSIPIRKETKDCCPYCNNEIPLKGFNTLFDVYPELAAMWRSENATNINSIIPNNTEKRKFSWHCNTCQHDFEKNLNIVLSRYLNGNEPNLTNICPNCTEIQENIEIK
ncbi:zinc-ribbon domain-containing protein [Streptococcus pluranimalium]